MSSGWFCLRVLERCEELSRDRGRAPWNRATVATAAVATAGITDSWGARLGRTTWPSPVSAKQGEDPRDSRWRLPPPRADLCPRGWQSPPKSLTRTFIPELILQPHRPHQAEPSSLRRGCCGTPGSNFSPRSQRTSRRKAARGLLTCPAGLCPAGLCPAAAAQVSDWPLLGARRLPRPIRPAAAQQRLLTARARAAAPADAGCSGSPRVRAAGSTATRDPAAAARLGDAVLPTSVPPLWSSGSVDCSILRVAP